MMPSPVAGAGAQERSASRCSECSDCSLCANKSQRQTRAGVRVSVNLRHFFSDQRARAFMWAPYGRCVRWLGRRVASVFGLPDDVALMSRGHMLPVNEPLLLLDQDDPIDVVNMPYVFTVRDNKLASTQRTTEALSLCSREASKAASSLNVKNENVSQLPTSSQPESCSVKRNITEVYEGSDSEASGSDNVDGQSCDDKQELARLKRRALQLLQEHCSLSAGGHPAPKRARRRLRRRKRPAAAALPAAETTADTADTADIAIADITDTAAAAEVDEVSVLRNGPGSRPPRLVPPLSPIVAQYVV